MNAELTATCDETYCMSVVVFRHTVTGAGLGRKQCGAGAGWESARGGGGLEVCGNGQDFSNSWECGCRAGADRN